MLGLLFSSIFSFTAAVFGIIFGIAGLLIGLILSFSEFLIVGPFVIFMVILGLVLWQPLIWIVVLGCLFYLYRINKKKRYIKIRRG